MKVRTIAAALILLGGSMLFATGTSEVTTDMSGQPKEIEWIVQATSRDYENPDLILWQLVEETANLVVNATPLSNDVAVDAINARIASRNLPDIISHGEAFDQLNLIAPSGPFVNVGENLEKVPNLKAFVDYFGEDALAPVSADDGELYNFPAVNTWEDGVFQRVRTIILRDDLLTNMEPEDIWTVADLESAFLNIRDNFGGPFLSLRDMASGSDAFDLMPRIMGTSVQQVPWFNPQTRKFENQYKTNGARTRAAVELMARWYQQGIIHPDFASQPDRQWEGMLLSGELAAEFESSRRLLDDIRAVKQIDPSFNMTIIPRPSYQGTLAAVEGKYQPFYERRNAFVSAQSEATDEIFVLFNDMYNTFNSETKWYLGPKEGVDYTVRDDGTYAWGFTAEQLSNNTYMESVEMNAYDYLTDVSGIGFEEFYRVNTVQHHLGLRWYTRDDLKPVLDYIDTMAAKGYDVYTAPVPKYGDQSSAAADIRTNVETYILENYVKFINGSRPLGEWDRFVAGLDSLRYDELVSLTNDAVQ